MMRWILFVAVLICYGHLAYAFEIMQQDRFVFYFPKGEENLASNLLSSCSSITAFLEDHHLPVPIPLHIVLDEDLDEPMIRVRIIPHREIRLPLRAPGVLEDGYTEPDPWQYFLFMGLCAQGIYHERSGIPVALHKVFGEIISPNVIIPDWAIDGVSFLLYEEFIQRRVRLPMAEQIFNTGPIPNLDKVSNHPDIWPGRSAYQIYGRPFIRWLYKRYGWEKMLKVFQHHGADFFPIEIDSEARRVYGMSWNELWRIYQKEHPFSPQKSNGLLISGYWADPFIYWNEMGVYPGMAGKRLIGRYGMLDKSDWLWLSYYSAKGVSQMTSQFSDRIRPYPKKHVWDPGSGAVAVTRQGSQPYLLLFHPDNTFESHRKSSGLIPKESLVPAPPGVIQMSGPVMDSKGWIAVSANRDGNWDIWLYDGTWHQVTTSNSVEMDPWIFQDHLIFASNISGRFQIHTIGMGQITHFNTAAVLPRNFTCLRLKDNGWEPSNLALQDLPTIKIAESVQSLPVFPQKSIDKMTTSTYSPLKSIRPNYIIPDIFIDTDRLQLGVSTEGRDVSGDFSFGGGIRYSFDDEIFSWRLDGDVNSFSIRLNRYPFSYTTNRATSLNELRYELKLSWTPARIEDMEYSVNGRQYTPDENDNQVQYEWWASLDYKKRFGNLFARINIDVFDGGSQSIYGGVRYRFGERINTTIGLQMGKTWGDLVPGHNSFRIGGNTGEGYFTHRSNRLFPLSGFQANILDASQAITTGCGISYPLAHLQTGYKTLPLFLRNLNMGIFADAGVASEHISREELLVSAGIEFVTGLELAWEFMADLRLGISWPLYYPDDLHPEGPVWLIQIGKPL